MFSDEFPNATLEEVLAHHGVKGMHWGVHKARNAETKTARAGRRIQKDKVNQLKSQLGKGGNDDKLKSQIQKLHDKQMADPERAHAARTTTGQKAALLVLGGPLGAAVIGANAARVHHITKSQAKAKKPGS